MSIVKSYSSHTPTFRSNRNCVLRSWFCSLEGSPFSFVIHHSAIDRIISFVWSNLKCALWIVLSLIRQFYISFSKKCGFKDLGNMFCFVWDPVCGCFGDMISEKFPGLLFVSSQFCMPITIPQFLFPKTFLCYIIYLLLFPMPFFLNYTFFDTIGKINFSGMALNLNLILAENLSFNSLNHSQFCLFILRV